MSGKGSGVEIATRDKVPLSSMAAESSLRSDDEDDERLIPGLPDEIILGHIVPRLRWINFHNLSSVSCRWREAIQSRHVYDARVRSDSTDKLFAVLHRASCDQHQPLTISLYSATDNSWHRLPNFPSSWEFWQGEHRQGIPRECQCITLNGNIYILGGVFRRLRTETKAKWSSTGNLDDVEVVCSEVYVLDLAGQREWKRCANMPQPRYAFGCGVVRGKILVIGGVTRRRKFAQESLVYDPKANVWSSIQPMQCKRYRPQVVAVGEELFVHSEGQSTTEVYHAGKDQWRFLKLFDHRKAEALFTAQGKVYMISSLSVYGLDNDSEGNCSWTRLHSISFGEEQLLAGIGVMAVEAINDELIVLLWGFNVRIQDVQVHLCRSIGFGSKKEEIRWDIIDTLRVFHHLMVPMQL